MMKNDVCVKVRGKVRGDEAMHQRQKGDPTRHWSEFMADQYGHYRGFRLAWTDSGDREIHLTEGFWDECGCGFEHILEFARINELEVENVDPEIDTKVEESDK